MSAFGSKGDVAKFGPDRFPGAPSDAKTISVIGAICDVTLDDSPRGGPLGFQRLKGAYLP